MYCTHFTEFIYIQRVNLEVYYIMYTFFRVYIHPESPARGHHWSSGDIVFNRVKITNSLLEQTGHVSWT